MDFISNMQIHQIYTRSPSYIPVNKTNSSRKYNYNIDVISFKGRFGRETISINGKKMHLRHQTALFRDMQTKNFVLNYIKENFSDKPEIRMVVGACSSGEEVYTYSMLLDSIKSKLSIIGFDISEKIVEMAKSGKILMQNPKEPPKGLIPRYAEKHCDFYLCFDSGREFLPKEQYRKQLFDEFLDITPEACEEKETLSYKIRKWLMAKIFRIAFAEYESKIVKTKDGKFGNCSFRVGDILELDKITDGNKADIITFSNAMYHLTTIDVGGMLRIPKKNIEEILRKVATKVKNNLSPNGIFVLGEAESEQMGDSRTLLKVFTKMGFEPLNETADHEANVFRLIE